MMTLSKSGFLDKGKENEQPERKLRNYKLDWFLQAGGNGTAL